MNSPLQQPSEGKPNPQLLNERLIQSVRRAETSVARLERNHGTLNLGGIVTSAGATALTGWTSMAGPIFGDSTAAWRLTCILAAILGFMTTLCVTIAQQQRFPERLRRANECVGRLKALQFEFEAGTSNFQDSWKEYSQILRQYVEELR